MALLDEWGNPIEARRFAHGARRGTGSGPDLRTRDAGIDRLIPAHDRKTLSALSRRIIFNAGPAKEAIRQKASYSVGGAYLPQYLGPDRDAGEIVEDWLVENFLPRVDRRGGGRDW